mmetsp:Transcript_45/g.166  ORF Transcript_45/g.166 Transcript_45/m.166 type:complete len:248 (+) Transcript_45:936-1679(+)
MLNAGQQCIAPDYVLCETEDVARSLTRAMAAAITAAFGANPKMSPDFGRIVSSADCARLAKMLAATESSTIVCGGDVDVDSKYVAPTIALVPPAEKDASPLLQGETFGPILPVVAVTSLEEAVAYVTERPKPLSLYVFTGSAKTARHVAQQTSSGSVCVNDCIFQVTHPHLPFGGVGDSGYGTYHGDATFHAFTHDKPVLVKASRGVLGRHANFFVYPPWTPLKFRLLDLVLAPETFFFSSKKKRAS